MRFKKTIITGVTLLGVTGAAFGIATPAIAANTASPSKPHATVKVDAAHHEATITTVKRGIFTVNWEPLRGGKVDLVTVHNSKDVLVAARKVPAARVDKAVKIAEAHPGALRKLWVHRHHMIKQSTAKNS